MISLPRVCLMAAIALLSASPVRPALVAETPADLCSLLPPAEASKGLGQTYGAPEETVAPRPFAGTNTGTDCKYHAKNGSELWFRAYVDPSPAAATELFARLRNFYGPPVPVSGVGDEAYFDRGHALHARKGKVRFYLNLSPVTASTEKQLKDLAVAIVGRL